MESPNEITVPIDFARQLERELNEAELTINRCWEELGIHSYAQAHPLSIFDYIHKLREELDEAKARCDQYLTRIQMVEEYKINDELLKQRDQWRKCAEELASCAEHIGWTSCEDSSVIRKSESVLDRFNELKGTK